MEDLDKKLISEITDLSNAEVQYAQIMLAIFEHELNDSYQEKITLINQNIDSQMKAYGKNLENFREEKNKIIEQYNEQFQKVYDKRKEQFCNIEIEIQEMQGNQKIAIANFKKIVDNKKKIQNTQRYIDFINGRNTIVDNQLREIIATIESYDKKLNALVNRYNGYKELIEECEKKLDECMQSSKKDFETIVKYRNSSMKEVAKQNFLSKFFSSILNKFSGKSKFEKDVIEKMENELKDVEKNNNELVDSIQNQTISIVATIQEIRDTLTSEFKLATE